MRSLPRLGDMLVGAFAVLLVLAVVHRAENLHSHAHKVAHAHVQVHHRRA